MKTARYLAKALGYHYRQAGSWATLLAEIKEWRRNFDENSLPLDSEPRFLRKNNPQAPGRVIGVPPGRVNFLMPFFFLESVIKDRNGAIIDDNREPQAIAKNPNPGSDLAGEKIYAFGREVGEIFVGAMTLDKDFPLQGNRYLSAVRRGLFVAFIVSLLVIILAGSLFIRGIVKPITVISRAVGRVEAGDLTVRLGLNSRDEIGALAAGFNDMVSALEQNENLKKKLISDTTHELRTPVSLIKIHLEMISEGVYPLKMKQINSLLEETDRLTQLLEQLQQLTYLEQNESFFPLSQFDLSALIDSIVSNFAPRLLEKEIKLSCQKPDYCQITGHPDRLRQVINNLLSNALRHTEKGGNIRLNVKEEREHRLVTLENDGPRIPADDLKKIFERFYRVDSARNRQTGGNGLGLAIGKEIIKQHNGSISASNQKNGVIFTITLPKKWSKNN